MLQQIKTTSKLNKFLLVVFIILVLFTRFFNLDGTARFTRDESSDLARMYEYYQNRQISLVGPISSEKDKVFSSLSYYMIMPFAILMDFTPVSVVYGMAFFGVITAALLLLLVRSINKNLIVPAGILIIIWLPLLIMSRWAWNPNFVVFWSALALLLYEYRKTLGKTSYLIMGMALGAMFHHHYVAIVTTAPFLFFISWPLIQKKQYKEFVLLIVGYILPHLLFVLFDLKNPPGLFFGRYLLTGNTPHVEYALTLPVALQHLWRNSLVYCATFIQNSFLQIIFFASLISLILKEFKMNTLRTATWIIPSITIIFAGIFLNDFQTRYVFSSIILIFVFLLIPRKEKVNNLLARIALIALILGSLLTLKSQLTIAQVQPNMRVVTRASQIIIETIDSQKLNNANIAALSSPDSAPLGEKYRDYIKMRGTKLREASEYDVSEHLFVVSTKTNEILRDDESYAMLAFRDKKLRGVFDIESEWKVFWYGTQ